MNHQIISLQPYLQKIAKYYTKDQNDADDLVQDTLLKALSKSHQFTKDTNLKAWVSTIMRNTFITDYRKRKRLQTVDISTTSHHFIPIAENDGEYEIFKKEIDTIILALKPDHRNALTLRQAGYTYQEMADELNKPLGTIKNQIHLARNQVKDIYSKLTKVRA